MNQIAGSETLIAGRAAADGVRLTGAGREERVMLAPYHNLILANRSKRVIVWHRVSSRLVGCAVATAWLGIAPSRATEPLPPVVERVRAMPVVWEHRYHVAAAIRFLPLPFLWITKEKAGTARIARYRATDGKEGFEILMGSDPERVPRRINRWGYVAEELDGSDAAIFAVMNQSAEKTLEEANARIAQERSEGRYLYSAYEAAVNHAVARGIVGRLWLPRDFTYRELDTVLSLARHSGIVGRTSHVALPSGTRPGFVAALTDLIHRDVARRHGITTESEPLAGRYVNNGSVMELTLRASRFIDAARFGGYTYANVVRGRFEGRKMTSPKKSDFEVIYGTEGRLAEVPIRLTFEARWWFRLDMTLVSE